MAAPVISEPLGEVVRFPSRLERSHIGEFVDAFVNHRRDQTSPRWLDENVQFLSVLRRTHADIPEHILAPYAAHCDSLLRELAFFPQHYRSYLALALEFRDLGLSPEIGTRAAEWIIHQNLMAGELSDFRRCEVKYLLARSGVIEPDWNSPLDLRVDAFVRRNDLFRLPNKKAATELIHLVFYRTAYGEIFPEWPDDSLPDILLHSLRAVGILSFLDQDVGLLAGACIALTMLGDAVPAAWDDWIRHRMSEAQHSVKIVEVQDDYHKYLMGCWYLGGLDFGTASGPTGFAGNSVFLPQSDCRPLTEILHVCRNEPDFERVISHKFYSLQTRQIVSDLEFMGGEFEQILRRIHMLSAAHARN